VCTCICTCTLLSRKIITDTGTGTGTSTCTGDVIRSTCTGTGATSTCYKTVLEMPFVVNMIATGCRCKVSYLDISTLSLCYIYSTLGFVYTKSNVE